jgi:dTDP-4-dehydrorhamnose 3,5-epimerase
MSAARPAFLPPPLKITESPLPGVFVIEPRVHGDARGFFVETFRESVLAEAGLPTRFVQDNHSRSRRGVLRGLHYQVERPQGKLVRVSRGRVFDVAVDVRRGSPHFGRWFGITLDDRDHRMLYIPPRFAHGFVVLSEEADFIYQCTEYYDPDSERGVAWNDPDIGIQWPEIGAPTLSQRDERLPWLAAQTDLPDC